MESVYLLLRNNIQSGPFTIGELLQQQLKPDDMIWIEGKSTAWTYLTELELIPFSPENFPVEENKEIHGGDEIERKAEELRQKILNAPSRRFTSFPVEKETFESPYQLPKNEIRFVDHRKQRKLVLGELAITCLVIGLFGVGIYKGREFLAQKKTIAVPTATKLVTNDNHTAQKSVAPAKTSFVDSTQHDSLATASSTVKPKIQLSRTTTFDSTTRKIVTLPVLNETPTEHNVQENTEKTSLETSQPIIKVPESIPEKKEIPQTRKDEKNNETSDDKENSKGFLKGIFKKKKKDNED